MTADEQRRRECKTEFANEWADAVRKLGHRFVLPPDLPEETRTRIAKLERNAHGGAVAYAAGAASLAEVRQVIQWWSAAVLDASKAFEPKEFQ
jgi:hypothetical protein